MKHLVSYQREVNKGKLTDVANFQKLTFPGVSPSSPFAPTKGSRSKCQSFSNFATAVNCIQAGI